MAAIRCTGVLRAHQTSSRQDLSGGLLGAAPAGRLPGTGQLGGGCAGRDPREDGLVSRGRGVCLLSLQRAGRSLIPGPLCFSRLSVTATGAKGSPRGGSSPLAGEGVQGVSDPAQVSPPELQLRVLRQQAQHRCHPCSTAHLASLVMVQ